MENLSTRNIAYAYTKALRQFKKDTGCNDKLIQAIRDNLRGNNVLEVEYFNYINAYGSEANFDGLVNHINLFIHTYYYSN